MGFHRRAQFADYEHMRAVFESRNAGMYQTADEGGRDGGLDPGFGLDDEGGYHGARKGGEPVHIQADPRDGSILAVNRTAVPLRGATAVARLHGLDGEQLGSALQRTLDVAASSAACPFTVTFGHNLPALHLLRLELRGADGAPLSQNTYWRRRRPDDLRALDSLGPTKITATHGHTRRADGGGEMSVTLRNTGPAVAAMVRISLRDKHTGDRVRSARCSDDFLALLPGESRDIGLTWTGGLPPGHTPGLWIEGCNVAAGTV